MKLLIFEGNSGSGKTAIIENLRKTIGISKSHDLVIDRFVHSRYVYDRIYKRNVDLSEYKSILDMLSKLDTVVVYIDADVSFSYVNCLDKDDNFAFNKTYIMEEKKYYEESFDVLPLKIIRVYNDGNRSLDDISLEICNKLGLEHE